MSKYRLRREDTGTEIIRDCNASALAPYRIGTGPIEPGARFRRKSKLDGKAFVEVLVSVQHKSVNTDYAGISHHATWPMTSYSMGVGADHIDEAKKADAAAGLKGVDYDPNTGDAIFADQSSHQRYCEAHGFFDRNGGYRSPKKRDERERDNSGLPQLAEKAPCGNAPIFLDEMLEQMQNQGQR